MPNKKVVGKDIILDQKADVDAMMLSTDALLYKEKPLAARLDLGTSMNMQFFLNDDDSPDA